MPELATSRQRALPLLRGNREYPTIKATQKRMSESRHLLETFDNEFPDREYKIEIQQPEFTSLCPKTGQPDFGVVTIAYTPKAKCVELKSLKFYLQDYRTRGIFYEHVTNTILDDLVAVTSPQWMRVEIAFHARGGITETVTAQLTAVI